MKVISSSDVSFDTWQALSRHRRKRPGDAHLLTIGAWILMWRPVEAITA